jgi:hypothetical protein
MNRLFPTDPGRYTGHPLARWALLALTVVTIARSLVHILAPDGGAQSIATIPLDSYTAPGAAAVVTLFALWGISQLLLGLVNVVVLRRYPGLIPLMYLLTALEYGLRLSLGVFKPLEVTGTAPGAVGNYVLVPLALVMLWLSLGKAEAG